MNLVMIIKTSGLEYDDRLRKEALSSRELGHQVQIIALENANHRSEKRIYGDIRATTISLSSRRWFPQSKGLVIKAIEFYARLLLHAVRLRPDVLWVHDLGILGIMPALLLLRRLGAVGRLVWDQHELPSDSQLASRAYMTLYRCLANGCDMLVMANDERRDLMQARHLGRLKVAVEVLNNYADGVFRRLPQRELPESIRTWLDGSPYVLAQGGASPGRHLGQLVAAIMASPQAKLVVVGPYQQDQHEELRRQYGDGLQERVLFTGYVAQLEIAPYIDHAAASIIFYATTNNNSLMCAPNRLYQAIARGTPVVVGPNPPMRRLVEELGCGVVVDHTDPRGICESIGLILAEQAVLRANTRASAAQFDWEQQIPVIGSLLDSSL